LCAELKHIICQATIEEHNDQSYSAVFAMDSDQQDMIAQFTAITGVNPSLVSLLRPVNEASIRAIADRVIGNDCAASNWLEP
jgi:hypothetical protein